MSDQNQTGLQTNFTSEQPPSYYAKMYKRDNLRGGHVIKLGPGNDEAAIDALKAFPGGLQIGGGITADNARFWLDQGSGGVIVTSYVFNNGQIFEERLIKLVSVVGKENLIIDLSCRKKNSDYYVVTDRWQKFTDLRISPESLGYLAKFCAEFLVHGVDVEGKCAGIDKELTVNLANWSPIPTTYAGGVKNLADLKLVKELGNNRIDVTIGSALDIFGGTGIKYVDAVSFCRETTP